MDWTLLLIVPAMIFAFIANLKVKSTFNRFSRAGCASGFTGLAAARAVLNANGLNDVNVARCKGELTDHYSPNERTLYLSESVYASSSQAAVGVAAHEAGHALQHTENYGPLQFRMAILPVTSFGSKAAIPLVLFGLILSRVSQLFLLAAYVGVALYVICVIFQLVTLPVEFDASKRALAALTSIGIVGGDEEKNVRKVLSAAAMTYVAALAVSLAQLLRLLLILSGGRRRR